MRIISESECHSWVADRLEEPFSWLAVERRYNYTVTYMVPTDAGRKTALARVLSELIDSSGEGLLWITEWGVFPSSENMSLFEGYRRSLDDERSLRAAPGHIFKEADLRGVECLLDLVLYFFWDVTVIDGGASWLRISHDEFFSVNATNDTVLRRWQESFAEFELEKLSNALDGPG